MVDMVNQGDCCGDLFKEFKFQDFSPKIDMEKKSGVYVIRVKKSGVGPTKILENFDNLISGNQIETYFQKYIREQVSRIENIEGCTVIYIGESSDLNRRHHRGIFESGNHPVRYPVWLLLFFGWELQIGWICTDDYKSKEESLLEDYKSQSLPLHEGNLPALNKRG